MQEHDWIVRAGTTYHVRAETVIASVERVDYDVETIASSRAAFGRIVRDRYEFELRGLTPGKRELVRNAIDEGSSYEATNSPDVESEDAALSRFGDRLLRERPIETDSSPSSSGNGTWLTEYEGTTYWTVFEFSDTNSYNELEASWPDAEWPTAEGVTD